MHGTAIRLVMIVRKGLLMQTLKMTLLPKKKLYQTSSLRQKLINQECRKLDEKHLCTT